MEIVHPSFNRIETHTLPHHVLTTFTTHVKWRLVSHLTTTHPFALDHFERFFVLEITFADFEFVWVEVFRTVVTVSP